jgi:hypothetical protein
MEPEPILGSFSLPLSDPRFVFANAAALANFLNGRERDNFEIVRAIGYYDDPGTQVHAGNFYEYEPVEIGQIGPAQPLSVLEVNLPWDRFVDRQVDRFEFQDHSKVILNNQLTEVVLVRALEHPLTIAGGQLGTNAPGWEWLSPQTELNPQTNEEDLVVRNARCSWFGGPHDNQDSGETASGKVNTRRQPDFRGCALPMNGFRNSQNTMGSPIPRFRWLTPIEVECIEPDLQGRKITVELIDLGPARKTKNAIDLTEPAFNALGAASSRGLVNVNFRIRSWRQHLEPGATFTVIPSSSSEQKPVDPAGNKIRPDLTFPPSFDKGAFTTFIGSLGLRFITAEELIPYFANVRNGASNQPPNPALWQNFVPTALVLDAVRAKLTAALHVTSSYRHPDYNRQLGGAASLSQHKAFRAADIQVVGKMPREVHQAIRELRGTVLPIPAGAHFSAAGMVNSENGIDSNTPFNIAGLQIQNPSAASAGHFLIEGGLGLYETFVHVDCRGTHADW